MASQTIYPADPSTVRWVAGKDRIGHAYRSSARGTRSACGLPQIDERWAWPLDFKCVDCRAALQSPTESEQRALWGDR